MSTIPSRYAIFNGWNFNNVPGLQVYAVDPPGQGNRTLNIFGVARASARKTSSAYYDSKAMNIGVYITAASRDALDQALDTLYANINSTEGTLVFPQSGVGRQVTASYSRTAINNAMQNTNSPASNYADLTLIFECSDSFTYDQYSTPISTQYAITSNNKVINYTQGGGVDSQVPYIYIYFNTAPTGSTNGTLTITNDAGQSIAITRAAWSQYDNVQIDLRAQTVQVNGVDVDFVGPMMTFAKGARSFTISDNFSGRNYNLISYVFNRWY